MSRDLCSEPSKTGAQDHSSSSRRRSGGSEFIAQKQTLVPLPPARQVTEPPRPGHRKPLEHFYTPSMNLRKPWPIGRSYEPPACRRRLVVDSLTHCFCSACVDDTSTVLKQHRSPHRRAQHMVWLAHPLQLAVHRDTGTPLPVAGGQAAAAPCFDP